MDNKTWFPAKTSRVVYLCLLLIGAICTLNPIAFGAVTDGGTSWQNIIATVTFLGAVLVALIDAVAS